MVLIQGASFLFGVAGVAEVADRFMNESRLTKGFIDAATADGGISERWDILEKALAESNPDIKPNLPDSAKGKELLQKAEKLFTEKLAALENAGKQGLTDEFKKNLYSKAVEEIFAPELAKVKETAENTATQNASEGSEIMALIEKFGPTLAGAILGFQAFGITGAIAGAVALPHIYQHVDVNSLATVFNERAGSADALVQTIKSTLSLGGNDFSPAHG